VGGLPCLSSSGLAQSSFEPASFSFPESVVLRGWSSITVRSPLPRAPAKIPVLDSPSTLYVPETTGGPDALGHVMLTSRRISTPPSRTMRRVAAFVELPGPQGVAERS